MSAAPRRLMRRPRAIAGAALLSVAMLQGCWTAAPHCPPGQHAVRAPSHQGHVWDCAKGTS